VSPLTVVGLSRLEAGTYIGGDKDTKLEEVVIDGVEVKDKELPMKKPIEKPITFGKGTLPPQTELAPGTVVFIPSDYKMPSPLIPYGTGVIEPGSLTTDAKEIATETLIQRKKLEELVAKGSLSREEMLRAIDAHLSHPDGVFQKGILDAQLAAVRAKEHADRAEKAADSVKDIGKNLEEALRKLKEEKPVQVPVQEVHYHYYPGPTVYVEGVTYYYVQGTYYKYCRR
jgi:hypothetical protein